MLPETKQSSHIPEFPEWEFLRCHVTGLIGQITFHACCVEQQVVTHVEREGVDVRELELG